MLTTGLAGAVSVCAPAEIAPGLRFAAEAEVAGDYVTLGDLADLTVLPAELRLQAAALRLAHIPAGTAGLTGRADAFAARARSLMPALAPWTRDAGPGRIAIRRRRDVDEGRRIAACLKVVNRVPAGEAPRPTDLVDAPCGGRQAEALSFDPRAGVAVAAQGLEVDQLVARTGALAAVRAGQTILLQARIGPVAVERRVETVQPARRGEAVFVRGRDGAIFRAPAPDQEAPQ